MQQVITGRFDALNQAEAAASKLTSIRANDVEISEWNGGSFREDEPTSGIGTANFGYGPNMIGAAAINGGGAGIMGLGIPTAGLGFLPFMGDDPYPQQANQGYILNALIQDEQRDKAVRIIRDAGGREF